jgi:hypothetical protein
MMMEALDGMRHELLAKDAISLFNMIFTWFEVWL